MKLSNQLTRFAGLLTFALLAGGCGMPASGSAQQEAQQKPAITQRSFASPDEAVKALQAAVAAKDKAALREIYGSEIDELLTGDEVQDANNAKKFAAAHGAGLQAGERGRRQNHSGSRPEFLADADSAGESGRAMAFRHGGGQGGNHQPAHRQGRTPRHRRLPGLRGRATAVRRREPGRGRSRSTRRNSRARPA